MAVLTEEQFDQEAAMSEAERRVRQKAIERRLAELGGPEARDLVGEYWRLNDRNERDSFMDGKVEGRIRSARVTRDAGSAEPALMGQCELREWCERTSHEAWRAYDTAELDILAHGEDEALLVAGTLCLRYGQPALWSAIYWTFHGHLDVDADEIEYLEHQTARAREGRSLSV